MSKHASASFALLASIAFSGAALAQPASHAQADAAVVAQTRTLMALVNESITRQHGELDAVSREIATWNEQDRARFGRTVMRSAVNLAYERQIAASTAELRAMLQASQRGEIKGREAETRFVVRLRAVLGQLQSATERQTAYLAREIRAVKGG